MKKYISHQLPKEIKTYISLIFASLTTVIFISLFLKISEYGQYLFKNHISNILYLDFLLAPMAFALIVFIDKHYQSFATGSGIPQLIAANDSRNKKIRLKLLGVKIIFLKIFFVFIAMLAGSSVSFGGPSVHIGGVIFYNFANFIKLKRKLLIHSFIAIGGSAGLIIAFNAPIAGFLFAYEEIGRKLKKQALILIAAICFFIYFIASFFTTKTNYLLDLSNNLFSLDLLWQLIPIAIITGILGGVFAKISLYLIAKFFQSEKVKIVIVAAIFGLIVAIINYYSDFKTSGTGEKEALLMLDNEKFGIIFIIEKYFATLFSFASTIAGGLFMTSITIGVAIGSEFSYLYSQISPQIIMIIAAVGYLSAVIRAPLTAAFMLLEMTNTLNLLLPAVIVAFIANFISKKISKVAIYEFLAQEFLKIKSNKT